MQRAILTVIVYRSINLLQSRKVYLTPPLSNVAAGAAAVHGAEADELTDSDDTSLGGAYSSSCDSIPTSENVKKQNKERKRKGNPKVTINDEIRPTVGNHKLNNCLCRSSSLQVDTSLLEGASSESDGDSTVEFLRVGRTPSEVTIKQEDGQGQKMKRSSKDEERNNVKLKRVSRTGRKIVL
jgi:hypothetical protein